MQKRFYPAVLERSAGRTFVVWFPDFSECVAGATTQEDALDRSETALAKAVDALVELDRPLPESTPFGKIKLPKGCRPIAYFAVGVEIPNQSERVNVYLPKNLIARADKRAEELGMSRSSFFGLAINSLIGWSQANTAGLTTPLSKIHRTENFKPVLRTKRRTR